MPACAQLPAGPLSRRSHVAQCRLARRCTGTAYGWPEKSVGKKVSVNKVDIPFFGWGSEGYERFSK